jgi:type II secretory pathway pseudopilin PulG
MKKKAFTLLEVIIAMTSFFLLLVVIISIYTKMIKLKYNIQARTNVTQDSYFVIEKINLLLKDYTIDYEEYFNRKNVGCDTYTPSFTRDVGTDGYCNLFTAYGNNSNINTPSPTHKVYFCSSTTNETDPYKVIENPGVQNGL